MTPHQPSSYQTLDEVCPPAEQAAERLIKRQRVQAVLAERNLDAVLISRHEDIAWFTAGKAEIRVGILRETGPTSLLITKDDRVFYLTTNNEAARMAAEEFNGLDYEPVIQPWYEADQSAAARSIIGTGTLVTDAPNGSMAIIPFYPLRAELTAGEVARYRWLGKHVAEAASEVLQAMQPGMTERGVQALLAASLTRRGILPSVFLDAFDHRIRSYRHAVPREAVLECFGMLGFCARRWGLSCSITRFVHFGPMPQELQDKFAAVAEVNSALFAATCEGSTAHDLFQAAKNAFAKTGYPGEELEHHQGGATGYLEREWVARPNGSERLGMMQAYAWNPNLQGAKIEDTYLLTKSHLELLTTHVPLILHR
jgi:Xaa-Pro dipeptidase